MNQQDVIDELRKVQKILAEIHELDDRNNAGDFIHNDTNFDEDFYDTDDDYNKAYFACMYIVELLAGEKLWKPLDIIEKLIERVRDEEIETDSKPITIPDNQPRLL